MVAKAIITWRSIHTAQSGATPIALPAGLLKTPVIIFLTFRFCSRVLLFESNHVTQAGFNLSILLQTKQAGFRWHTLSPLMRLKILHSRQKARSLRRQSRPPKKWLSSRPQSLGIYIRPTLGFRQIGNLYRRDDAGCLACF